MRKGVMTAAIFMMVLLAWGNPDAQEINTNIFQAHAKQSKQNLYPKIEQAKAEYLSGNLEEANSMLLKRYHSFPESVELNYYLALSYQGLLDYQQALFYFARVIKLQPDHGNAYSHLGELHHVHHQFKQALAELKRAEQLPHDRPAYTAYLLGLIYLHNNQFDNALGSLQKAIELNKSFTQKSEYSKGITYFKMGNNKLATRSFELAIAEDPESKTGLYADLSLKRVQSLARKNQHTLQANIQYSFAFDDNVILNPAQLSLPLLVSKQSDFRHSTAINIAYNNNISDAITFNLGYQFSQNLHHTLHQYDLMGHIISASTSYNIDPTSEVGIQVIGDYFNLNKKSYMRLLGGYIFYQFEYNQHNDGKIRLGIRNIQFYQQAAQQPEARDGTGSLIEYTFTHLFSQNNYLLANASYEQTNTTGSNWDSYTITADLLISHQLQQQFRAELYGSYSLQNFKNVNSLFLNKRRDKTYNASAALVYQANSNWNFTGQYARLNSRSTISIYTYVRNIYSLSTEYTY